MIGTLSSRIVGFVREVLIAHKFGASEQYDIFLVASTIPLILVSALYYALPGVFVPQYLELKVNKNEKEANLYFSRFTCFYGLGFLFLTVLFWIFAPYILKYYYITSNAQDFLQAVWILRITSVIIFFGVIFTIFKSVLNANRIFLLPAFSPFFQNLAIILFLLFLADRIGIYALAFGFTFGYFLEWLVVYIYSQTKKIKFNFITGFKDTIIRKSISALFLITIINILGQLYTIIDRAFNGYLPEGAIASLNYANVLCQIPINLLGVTLGTAIFPSISELLATNQMKKYANLVTNSLKFIILIVIPMSFFIYFYSQEIITLVYKRGQFDNIAVTYSSSSLKYLSLGILAFVCYPVLLNIFYTLRHYKYILISGFFVIVVKYLLSLVLVREYYHAGLAMTTSISVFINIIIVYYILNKRFVKLDHLNILLALFKVIIISIMITIIMKMFASGLNSLPVFYSLTIKFLIWFALYAGAIFLFKTGNPVKLLGKNID